MGTYLVKITNYLWSQSWHLVLLIIVIAAVSWALKNRSAHVRYLLWLIVICKCLIPPFFIVPIAILPQDKSVEQLSPPSESAIVLNTSNVMETDTTQLKSNRLVMPSVGQISGAIWIVGIVVFCFIAIMKVLKSNIRLRQQRRSLPNKLQACIEEVFSGFGIKVFPKVWLLEGVGQPFVWGMFRGSIYLPTDYLKIDNVAQRKDILSHEVCHILRLDAAVNSLQVIAQAIFWFHPFVWWANQKMRQEREKCCDEMAVAYLGIKAKEYSTAIVKTLISEHESNRPVPTLAVADQMKHIEERIKTMLRPGKKFYKRPSLVVATVVLFIAFLTIPTTLVLTARGGVQPSIQNAGKPTTDSEKSQQPRFAARTFNSKAAFIVWFQDVLPNSERQIGRTPSATPLQIPACSLWGVQILAPVNDWDLLIRELSQNEVPSLILDAVDSDLKQLASLVKLLSLNLRYSKVTDAGLEYLKDMSQLEELNLRNSKVTDAGLEYLKGMSKLEQLNLMGTPITEAGLEHLKGLTGLKGLYFAGNPITDAGLEHLKGLTGLQTLVPKQASSLRLVRGEAAGFTGTYRPCPDRLAG